MAGRQLSRNPLIHRDPEQTTQDARRFWRDHGLQNLVEIHVFVRAVLAVREPEVRVDTLNIDGLTDIERQCLAKTRGKSPWTRIKQLSRAHVLVLTTCALAAITQGWDQSSMNGANLGWPHSLKLDIGRNITQDPTAHDVWIFGLINAAPFLSGSLFGCWCSDTLNELRFGRRGAIFVAGLFSFASVIGAACVEKWQHLLACRLLLGIGMGAKASVVPILASEIAPKDIRGIFVTCWQLFDTFGILLGFAANLIVLRLGNENNWRFMIAAAFVPALLLFVLILFCVESPRWLMKKGRIPDALKTLIDLHGHPSPIVACGDLYLTYTEIQEEAEYFLNQEFDLPTRDPVDGVPRNNQRGNQATNFRTRFKLLFTHKRMKRAAFTSMCVMIAQQACGINILAFLSSTLFSDSFNLHNKSIIDQDRDILAMSLGFGVANFIPTVYVFRLIDRMGRRFLLNISFPLMALFLFISGMILLGDHKKISVQVFYIIFVICFTAAYSIGEGPAAFVISSEIFPLLNREIGMSFAVFCNFLGAGILALFAPIMAHYLKQPGLLGLFAFFNLVAWAACFLYVPDTEKESLETINRKFEISSKEHREYQWLVLKRHFQQLRGKRVTRLPPIEDFYSDRQQTLQQEEQE